MHCIGKQTLNRAIGTRDSNNIEQKKVGMFLKNELCTVIGSISAYFIPLNVQDFSNPGF